MSRALPFFAVMIALGCGNDGQKAPTAGDVAALAVAAQTAPAAQAKDQPDDESRQVQLEQQRIERDERQKADRAEFVDGRSRERQFGVRLAHLRTLERGHPVEFVSIVQRGEVFRVTLTDPTAGGANWTEIMTLEGEHVFIAPVDLKEDAARTELHLRFGTCLRKAGLLVYVDPSQRSTQQQLELIGDRAALVTVVCTKGVDDPACKQAKITALPTLTIADIRIEGVQSRAWLEAATGCK